MQFNIIKPTILTPEQKNALANLMTSGHIALKKYNFHTKDLRKDVFASLSKWNGMGDLLVGGTKISQEDAKSIKELKKNEYLILQSVSKLVLRLAKKRFKNSGMGLAELYQEGIAITIDCIYYFSRSDVQFSSYLSRAIINKFNNLSCINKGFSPNDLKLLKEYEEHKILAENKFGYGNFEEITRAMNLNNERRSLLQKLLVIASPHKPIIENIPKPQENHDYLDFDPKSIMEKANLTDWEKNVLKAFGEGGSGWKTRVAQNNINPRTRQPYSRAAANVTLNIIKKKMLAIYDKAI